MTMFACSGCGKILAVSANSAGAMKCPHCSNTADVAAAQAFDGQPTLAPTADQEHVVDATQDGAPSDDVCELPPDFLAPPQAPDEIGRLGPYRVLKVLGVGGMGMVFMAEDSGLKRIVALKVMLPALAANESSRKRFVREAQAAASIEHEHIVTIHQVGEDRGVPFIAMQFLKGESLDQRLKRHEKLSLRQVVRIGREAALGLDAAHQRGLVHRDIKPANLWLEAGSDRVKILDFGLARGGGANANLTGTGAVVGTPAYMAPEQANAKPIDARTDLFSLGCVLYRLTTGKPPFKGVDTLSTLAALALEHPKPPRELNPAVPLQLSDLVVRLLEKDPQNRPASAAGVAGDLAALEKEATLDDRIAPQLLAQPRDTKTENLTPGSEMATAGTNAATVEAITRRPRLWWLGGGIASLVAVAAILVWVKIATRGDVNPARVPSSNEVTTSSARDTSSPESVAASSGSANLVGPTGDERTLALWCLGAGADSVIMVNDLHNFVTCKVAGQVPDKGYHIAAVSFQKPNAINNGSMKHFANLARLETLILSNQPVSDQGVMQVRGCLHLKTLMLTSTKTGDQALQHIADNFTELQSLDISNTSVTGTGLVHLKKLTQLNQLEMSGLAAFKQETLASLQGMSGLRELDLSRNAITNDGLAHLQKLPSLERLQLDQTLINDDGLEALLELPALSVLSLADTKIGNAGMATVAKIEGLTDLVLMGTLVDNQGLAALKDLKNLSSLFLYGLHVNDDGIAHLRGLPSLAHLMLFQTEVTDACLPHLKAMKSLKGLDIRQTKITADGIKKIKDELPPQVEVTADEDKD
jgi:serine/threonine protein kinase